MAASELTQQRGATSYPAATNFPCRLDSIFRQQVMHLPCGSVDYGANLFGTPHKGGTSDRAIDSL
jgi:hypothetical protein